MLKRFSLGSFKKERGLVFLLGYLKDTFNENTKKGNLHVGGKLFCAVYIILNGILLIYKSIS